MVKVFHVQIGEEHYYFGSKKAIFETLGKETLGINYSSFRNIKDLCNVPYRNKKCIIREGVLLRSSSEKSESKDMEE